VPTTPNRKVQVGEKVDASFEEVLAGEESALAVSYRPLELLMGKDLPGSTALVVCSP
jgi:hypothetical protein